jgi:aldoxime dehydratase
MESAIPQHLQTARSRHRRVPDDYRPPYPSFVARHKPTINRVVMAYFGVQYRGDPSSVAMQSLAEIAARFAGAYGASHWDRAQYLDQAGFSNVVSVALLGRCGALRCVV